MKRCVPLEAEAEAVCNESSVSPLIFQLPQKQGREILEKAQDTPVCKYPANISVNKINTGKWGTIPVYFVTPKDTVTIRNAIFLYSRSWLGIWQFPYA